MLKLIITTVTAIVLCSSAVAQKGQVWPTETRQEFDIDEKGKISKEYPSTNYYSYYLFINNNEFIHTTGTITSLYKILKRYDDNDKYTDYEVISEAGNVYNFRFAHTDKYIVISSNKGYSIYHDCKAMYKTKVFDNLNR
jgi:hypothetical protein